MYFGSFSLIQPTVLIDERECLFFFGLLIANELECEQCTEYSLLIYKPQVSNEHECDLIFLFEADQENLPCW